MGNHLNDDNTSKVLEGCESFNKFERMKGFLLRVKEILEEDKESYSKFEGLMEAIRDKRINMETVVAKMENLLAPHADLLQLCKQIFGDDHFISKGSSRRDPLTFREVYTRLLEIKTRRPDDQSLASFFGILKQARAREIPPSELNHEITMFFSRHNNLMNDFRLFFPDVKNGTPPPNWPKTKRKREVKVDMSCSENQEKNCDENLLVKRKLNEGENCTDNITPEGKLDEEKGCYENCFPEGKLVMNCTSENISPEEKLLKSINYSGNLLLEENLEEDDNCTEKLSPKEMMEDDENCGEKARIRLDMDNVNKRQQILSVTSAYNSKCNREILETTPSYVPFQQEINVASKSEDVLELDVLNNVVSLQGREGNYTTRTLSSHEQMLFKLEDARYHDDILRETGKSTVRRGKKFLKHVKKYGPLSKNCLINDHFQGQHLRIIEYMYKERGKMLMEKIRGDVQTAACIFDVALRRLKKKIRLYDNREELESL